MPENPLRRLRLDAGLTIDQLCANTNVSRQLIIRAEQGTYVNPPPSLADYFLIHKPGDPPITAIQLRHEYAEFQSEIRSANRSALLPTVPVPPPSVHPLTFWRMASGIPALIQFCKLFCIQHSIAHKFESTRSFKTVPTSIRAALYDASIDTETLDLLELYYQNYRHPERPVGVVLSPGGTIPVSPDAA